MMIKAPAAMARAAITVWSPEKPKLSSGIRPVRISQTASSSIPMFLVIFIDILLLVTQCCRLRRPEQGPSKAQASLQAGRRRRFT
jgi:hypothetical protein